MTWRSGPTGLLGVRYPIMQAGMGAVACGPLAAAGSEAGGVGCIGASRMTPAELERETALMQATTSAPFGVDFLFLDLGEWTGAPRAPAITPCPPPCRSRSRRRHRAPALGRRAGPCRTRVMTRVPCS